MGIFTSSLKHALTITLSVLIMMILVDYLNILTEGKLENFSAGRRLRQYIIASLLGAIPGCLGAYMAVTMYVHGLISFGAISACMIATSGDEAFVMFALFPRTALFIHILLFVIGIAGGYLIDKIAEWLKIIPCQECTLSEIHAADSNFKCINFNGVVKQLSKMSFVRFLLIFVTLSAIALLLLGLLGSEKWHLKQIIFLALSIMCLFIFITAPNHYLEQHIWNHILKAHIWKVFLWTFGALLIVGIGLSYFNIESFIRSHIILILLLSALVGIIPQSGPNLIFVMLFSNGLIPPSVLLTNSIVQDGHGMLPLLSYTIKDSIRIKFFNFLLGLILGGIVFAMKF